ncbi:serine/threonine protein kinase [Paenibacillus soyae]|uniref:Serine/threonine protein kinase n=1 Tax=Paenibacillus soyae TaxID=2969249 RepID=A0A9X2MN94_9BACL|nr:serine/threonine protein kinase [Paenibacillus soyae]MCR2802786.1 serine/threonine protein kinase [Paenibacillus soyae]
MEMIKLNEITFQLKEPHSLEWVTELGEVFAVFDQQDSGNISFGIETPAGKKFVKYAGAKTIHYNGEPQEAIERLQAAIPLYQRLAHPSLVKLVDHFHAGEGFAAVFEWFDGENLHPHWTFPPPAKYEDPASPYYRYKQLPLDARLTSLEQLFVFHLHVADQGFVAVDFYDGSILYDFATHSTKICDIDVYQKKPFINTMGRLWGSKRFMSPEEFQLGAEIDEITNVFNMGAMAFSLLGGELDRSIEKWEASKGLYEVALRAASADRERRYQSLVEFYWAWTNAKETI